MDRTYLVIHDQTKRPKIVKRRFGAETGYRLVMTCEPGVDAASITRLLNAQDVTGRRLQR